ncbi:hypothetical protein H0H87_006753 [Tephrocybe sp. NHM501043]|nr:hypothetical protein H0H87_006753 [Tephrocybe sp. NHM501043]
MSPAGQMHLQLPVDPRNVYIDSRSYNIHGPSKNVRLYRATPGGGGAISRSEDGVRCAVTGKECQLICLIHVRSAHILEALRILHISDGSIKSNLGHKSSVGRGGYRIDASRNFWEGSGLKIDSASTDVAWGHGSTFSEFLQERCVTQGSPDLNMKILTSARNGELIMWDINKAGPSKYGL